jgi:GntP family gluconate:H+ symporter
LDPDTTVTTSVGIALLGLAGCVLLLLVLIARWKWHVFLALLVPILLFGVLPGVQRNNFIQAFELGFGKTLGSIGIVIVLGSVMAEALRHTGGVRVITDSMVRLVGAKRMPFALTLSGFVLGIAIFSDVAYVILNPLVHSAAHAMGVGIGTMSIGLVGALQLTHAIVPPTPGPLAAAALVGADIGKTIIFGSVACLAGAVAGWAWGQLIIGPRLKTLPDEEFLDRNPRLEGQGGGGLEGRSEVESGVDGPFGVTGQDQGDPPPSTLMAYAPIAVPVLLISAQSVADLFLSDGNPIRGVLGFVGWPVVALAIGLWLALLNMPGTEGRDRTETTNLWVKEGLKTSAMILVVTGLGGSLSEILKGTPAVESVAALFSSLGLPGILLPFILGVIGNMITGSTTVGVITAGSLVAPMLGGLGLSPEAAMLSGASGSVIIKYVNSSYFWVCTSLTRMELREALLGFGGATLVGGLASFGTVWMMWGLGWI